MTMPDAQYNSKTANKAGYCFIYILIRDIIFSIHHELNI